MYKYLIQYGTIFTPDNVETKQHFLDRKADQRDKYGEGLTDDEFITASMNDFWNADRKLVNQAGWTSFENDQTVLKALWDKRLATGKDYIQSSPTKASLIQVLTDIEKEVHMIWHSKAVEVELMQKMKDNDTGNNMEYDKVKAILNNEITTIINPVGQKIQRMIMDIANKMYMSSFDETRMEFTLTLMTSTETFGGTTPSDIIDSIATRVIELFEKLKADLHENDNDYRTSAFVKYLKTNIIDDEPEVNNA